jgi:hypothetical protein
VEVLEAERKSVTESDPAAVLARWHEYLIGRITSEGRAILAAEQIPQPIPGPLVFPGISEGQSLR